MFGGHQSCFLMHYPRKWYRVSQHPKAGSIRQQVYEKSQFDDQPLPYRWCRH